MVTDQMEIVMKTAAEAFREEANRQKLTTGSEELDALIDGVRQGQFHLFYGDDEEALDLLIHKLLANCVLPVDRGGLAAKGLYLNLCNNNQKKTTLDRDRLSLLAKHIGIDPSAAFENILNVSASEAEQLTATQEVSRVLEQNPDLRLLIIHNLTEFVETSDKPPEARQTLKKVVEILRELAANNDLTVVVSCSASQRSKGRIPRPECGTLLLHEAQIVVFLRRVDVEGVHAVRACLVKHPYKECPHSITLYVPNGGLDLLGRMSHHLDNSSRTKGKNLEEPPRLP